MAAIAILRFNSVVILIGGVLEHALVEQILFLKIVEDLGVVECLLVIVLLCFEGAI
jgi:hypothetical protein